MSSFWDDVDEVVVADTGSKDGTVAKLREFAKAKRQARKLKIMRFPWADDFSAARNHVDAVAKGKWLLWADFDDEVIGAGELRKIAETADDDAVAFFCHYTYAQDSFGNVISELWRERLVRNGAAKWDGRLHEHKVFAQGHAIQLPVETARWVHHRKINDQSSGVRNQRILKWWDEEEPDNPRIIQSLGLEYLGANDWDNAIPTLERYLAHTEEPAERRAQASRYLTQALMQIGRVDEAEAVTFTTLREVWNWTDTHLSLAEIAQTRGNAQDGLQHALTALAMGKPQSILILNPLQYTAHPRAIAALCEMQLGHHDEALRYARETLDICPDYPLVAAYLPSWQQAILKEQAVNAWLACVKLLEDHNELGKAKELLHAAPFFAVDDPRLIAKRVGVWHASKDAPVLEPLDPESAAAKFIERHLELAA